VFLVTLYIFFRYIFVPFAFLCTKKWRDGMRQLPRYSTDSGERELRPFREEPETLLYFN